MTAPETRHDIGRWLRACGYRTGAEIGVEQGKFAKSLCRAGLDVLCVDPWTAQTDYRRHLDQSAWDRLMAQARERLAPYGARLLKATSLAAAAQTPDESLDFVYIDARHDYESVRADIRAWAPKVRRGGVVAGHDYNLDGVKRAVDEWCASVMVTTERSPSWICHV